MPIWLAGARSAQNTNSGHCPLVVTMMCDHAADQFRAQNASSQAREVDAGGCFAPFRILLDLNPRSSVGFDLTLMSADYWALPVASLDWQ